MTFSCSCWYFNYKMIIFCEWMNPINFFIQYWRFLWLIEFEICKFLININRKYDHKFSPYLSETLKLLATHIVAPFNINLHLDSFSTVTASILIDVDIFWVEFSLANTHCFRNSCLSHVCANVNRKFSLGGL